MRYSRQRELILQEIQKGGENCFTAIHLHDRLRATDPHLSLGTVYRDLNQLAEAGQLCRIGISGQPDHYCLDENARAYFFCCSCNAVTPIHSLTMPLTEATQKLTIGSTPRRIDDFICTVTGLCPCCMEKIKNEESRP